ncbi:MAG TPA: TetR/AcrR family transcriptional regulator, partial [Bacteroidales bacterium]|nr:TetR/AcrR family transcriptional regulator [Bacteroidales bacterium]
TKLERIKLAAIELIVSNGYGGASISKIAKMAGVAEGYLYRHYPSKQELVKDLLRSNLNQIVETLEQSQKESEELTKIFEIVIRLFFNFAKTEPHRIKFLFALMNDYNFVIDEEIKSKIIYQCIAIKKIGLAHNQLDPQISEEDIYLFGVSYPIVFINHRIKNYFDTSELDEDAIQKVLRIVIKALF